MADVLTYKVSVDAPATGDVVTRELSLVVDGGDPVLYTFSANDTDLGEIRVAQGSSAVVSLVDVDDAGNRSEPAVVEFTAVDTIPPAKPGTLGVTLVAEETDAA